MSTLLQEDFIRLHLNILSESLNRDHCEKGYYNGSWREIERLKIVKQLIASKSAKNFVDLGCRDGYLTNQLLNGVEENIICVDGDEYALSLCQERLKTKVKIVHADLNYPLHINENFCDFVFSGETIEHLYNPENLVGEAYRILRPDGYFVGSTPNALRWEKRLSYLFGYDPKEFSDTMHLQYFSKKSLRTLLQKYFSKVQLYSYTSHFTIKYCVDSLVADGFIWLCIK